MGDYLLSIIALRVSINNIYRIIGVYRYQGLGTTELYHTLDKVMWVVCYYLSVTEELLALRPSAPSLTWYRGLALSAGLMAGGIRPAAEGLDWGPRRLSQDLSIPARGIVPLLTAPTALRMPCLEFMQSHDPQKKNSSCSRSQTPRGVVYDDMRVLGVYFFFFLMEKISFLFI